jgi:hypothetical protein
MAIIAGIDEAGYGPFLGPLVITAVVFEVHDSLGDKDLWRLLDGAVASRPRDSGPRIVVGDSKRLYSRKRGLGRLEEGVLAFQWLLGDKVSSFQDLLGSLNCFDLGNLKSYPWYQQKDLDLPITYPRVEINNHSSLLKEVLSSKRVRFLGARSIALSPKEFNEQLAQGYNKALLLFKNCANLLSTLWEDYGRLEAFCGKHGGRNRYSTLLSHAFQGSAVEAFSEGNPLSCYEIRSGDKKMRVSFIKSAEESHFPVALASMYCKYLRELFLKLFNKYWQEKLPGLRPTAGYPMDARRFLKNIDKVKVSLRISDEILVRNR